MQTHFLEATKISKASELLKKGRLVAFPTETVYGLGAPVFLASSIQKIFNVKGRPSNNPLIAHISDLGQVDLIAKNPPSLFYELAYHFFPGPLTLVVEKQDAVPSIASGGLSTIGIRMPNHALARELIRKVGVPLVAPSANLSGKPSSTSASHVLEDFNGKIAAVLDGGPCAIGIESTVLYLSHEGPILLRPGAITADMITKVIGLPVMQANQAQKAHSPGTRYRHYAPKAELHLFSSQEDLEKFDSQKKHIILTQITRTNLFASLREADSYGYEEICILLSEKMQSDIALMDRLLRASEKKV